jgi:DNA-binding FadR family transcriptional regulator
MILDSGTLWRATDPRSHLTYGVVDKLGTAIVAGCYSDTNPFPIEDGLCEQYKASRSVIREAVKMLTAKGLLSARPRQGTKTLPESRWNLFDSDVLRWLLRRNFSRELLIEFTEIRLAIEPSASALAAEKATPEQLVAIHNALDRMRAADLGEDDPLEADIAFHVAILTASGNRFFAQLSQLSETALRFSIKRAHEFKGISGSLDDRGKVAQAIFDRRPSDAEHSMRGLLRGVLDVLKTGTPP